MAAVVVPEQRPFAGHTDSLSSLDTSPSSKEPEQRPFHGRTDSLSSLDISTSNEDPEPRPFPGRADSGSSSASSPSREAAAVAAVAACGVARLSAPRPIAARALLARMGAQPSLHGWFGYLPAGLRAAPPLSRAPCSGCPVCEPCSCSGCRSCAEALTCGGLERAESNSTISTAACTPCASSRRSSRQSSLGSQDSCCCGAAGAATSPRRALIARVSGHVWALSRVRALDPVGCREVQDAMDAAAAYSYEALRSFSEELRGHVPQAMRCPHANHVLQKLIGLGRPEELNFIIEEILARPGLVSQAARHRYGCRIIQQVIQRFTPKQLTPLVDMLLDDILSLSCHPFGNYVIQRLLTSGTEEQRRQVIQELERNPGVCGQSTAGCAVINVAMEHGDKADIAGLARAISQQRGLLVSMALARVGNSAVARVLQELPEAELPAAREQLLESEAALRNSRFGRAVAEQLGFVFSDDFEGED